MLPEPKPSRPPPKPYQTSSLFIIGYLKRSCWINAETLKVSWQLISVCWWGPNRYGLAHTTHRLTANMRGSTPLWLACWECYPQRRNQSGRTTLERAYNCTQNSATGFSHYYLMYGRQPHLPLDVTLGLAPQSITALSTSQFVQKTWECIKWAHKKAETFQSKEAQCHKQNYDKRCKAAALEVGDMVLVCVTAFKGHHKIQDQWEKGNM